MLSISRSRLVIAIALFYAIAYSLFSLWYLQLTIDPDRSISLVIQLPTLLLAISGTLYLFSPTFGHPIIILSSTIACVCAKNIGNVDDAWFFAVVSLLLIWKLNQKIRISRKMITSEC